MITITNLNQTFSLTYLDKISCVAEWELEGAVAAGEAERAGLVVTLEVVVSRQHPAQPRHHRHQPACRDGGQVCDHT